jgi:hypothetical protein
MGFLKIESIEPNTAKKTRYIRKELIKEIVIHQYSNDATVILNDKTKIQANDFDKKQLE